MKVLVADKLEDSGRRGLAEAGFEVLYEPELTGDGLTKAIADSGAEVLIVRSTKVTRAMLEGGKLALVVRAGAGTNTIDVKAASERGIQVANCPGKNAIAVAELAFALMLALDRHVVDGAADLRDGKWNKRAYSKAKGLFGRTLGVLGAGNIGREVIARAKAFGMPVVVWSHGMTNEEAAELGVVRVSSPTELAAQCDVLTVHVALVPETRGLIGDAFFSAMRQGAYFINTSRAEVIDEAALERAVRERGVRAGLDVFVGEPEGGTGSVSAKIFTLPGVIGSHHIGASTDQAQEATAAETVRIVLSFRDTRRAPNVVNLAKKSKATHLLVVRHYDRVGVLAAVFDILKRAGVNVQETENIVFEGGQAAVARIHVDHAAADADLESVRASSPHVLDVAMVPIH
ncbi:MAG: hydroxyacid dehydrogenase [Deltaproteobacteria bacterium]|nr:hydroxyacid dehydrogenase [Deltaproteobacteria bacterium]